MKHIVVAGNPGKFYGWPANPGIWSWGNEILVGFTEGSHKESKTSLHYIDGEMPTRLVLARSLDGGESWSITSPDSIQSHNFAKNPPSPCPGGIDFSTPDTILLFSRSGEAPGSDSWFFDSPDRGHTWRGPWRVPKFGYISMLARTDYMVIDKDTCGVFLTHSASNGYEGVPFYALLKDGGAKWEFISDIGPEPEDGFRIMPASVILDDGMYLVTMRTSNSPTKEKLRDCMIECWRGDNEGRGWTHLCDIAKGFSGSNGNPPAMAKLPDGRVVLVYGWREKPFSMRACVTSDGGTTWSNPIMLRDDGGCGDIGYPRLVVRPDGVAVAVYYYTTDIMSERFIGATLFKL